MIWRALKFWTFAGKQLSIRLPSSSDRTLFSRCWSLRGRLKQHCHRPPCCFLLFTARLWGWTPEKKHSKELVCWQQERSQAHNFILGSNWNMFACFNTPKTNQFPNTVQCFGSLKRSVLVPDSLRLHPLEYQAPSDWSAHTCLTQHC